jgi:hypothetical protein
LTTQVAQLSEQLTTAMGGYVRANADNAVLTQMLNIVAADNEKQK